MGRPQPPHSDRAHRAITAMLTMLLFPHREEYEELLFPLKEGALYQ